MRVSMTERDVVERVGRLLDRAACHCELAKSTTSAIRRDDHRRPSVDLMTAVLDHMGSNVGRQYGERLSVDGTSVATPPTAIPTCSQRGARM